MDKEHLGDGCYCEFDGFHFVLTAEDGISVQSTVYLDPYVVKAFDNYRERLRKELESRTDS
jgi:hypothetical protein